MSKRKINFKKIRHVSNNKEIHFDDDVVWPEEQQERNTGGHLKLKNPVSAKTKGQASYIRDIVENTLTVCTGPSGCGKSFLAAGLGSQMLVRGEIEKIILTRPIVSAGNKKLGAMPGELSDKIAPYLTPLVDRLQHIMGPNLYKDFFSAGQIVIHPLELMRGMDFHNSFMILDESQNSSMSDLIMFVTRMGENSKVIINGDIKQSDLGRDNVPLSEFISKINGLKGFAHSQMTVDDIVRNPFIKAFLSLV